MKISKDTLTIIKNYSSIHNNLLLNGDILKTVNDGKSLVAFAKIPEKFPEFGIWNLQEFLAAIALFNNPEWHFEDEDPAKYVIIDGGERRLKYFAAAKKTLLFPKKDKLDFPDSKIDFELPKDILDNVKNACRILQVPTISVIGDGKTLRLAVKKKNVDSVNYYEEDLGDTKEKFQIHFEADHFEIIPADYSVSITTKGISRFTRNSAEGENKLEYFLSVDGDTNFGTAGK